MGVIRGVFGLLLCLIGAVAQANPTVQHWTLDNGARVYFVESRGLPMLQIQVVFDAGSARDGRGRNGLSYLTNTLLNDGTGELDTGAIARGFERLGAEYGSSSGRDMATVSLRILSDRKILWPAAKLFARIIREPSFPVRALERGRAQALVSIRRAEQSPSRVAGKTFMHLLYGDHPYATSSLEDPVAVKALRREDLFAFHKRYYVGKNALIVIVGDASRQTAKHLAKIIVGKLPAGQAAPKLPPVRPLTRAVTKRVPFPSTQTYIFTGYTGIRRDDPDFFPLYVGNHILGGGSFTSRLFDVVREKHGLSYSIYSHFQPQQQTGIYYMYLQTNNTTRKQALQLMRQTFLDFFRQGPTKQELAAAKRYLTGNYPLTMDTSSKIAAKLAMIGFYRLPLNYLDKVTAKINAVTLKQIRDAYHRHLQPDKFVTVIVGG